MRAEGNTTLQVFWLKKVWHHPASVLAEKGVTPPCKCSGWKRCDTTLQVFWLKKVW